MCRKSMTFSSPVDRLRLRTKIEDPLSSPSRVGTGFSDRPCLSLILFNISGTVQSFVVHDLSCVLRPSPYPRGQLLFLKGKFIRRVTFGVILYSKLTYGVQCLTSHRDRTPSREILFVHRSNLSLSTLGSPRPVPHAPVRTPTTVSPLTPGAPAHPTPTPRNRKGELPDLVVSHTRLKGSPSLIYKPSP